VTLTITEYLLALIRVWQKERKQFILAIDDYSKIKYLVDKVMGETNGKASPELAEKTIKAVVSNMASAKMKGESFWD